MDLLQFTVSMIGDVNALSAILVDTFQRGVFRGSGGVLFQQTGRYFILLSFRLLSFPSSSVSCRISQSKGYPRILVAVLWSSS